MREAERGQEGLLQRIQAHRCCPRTVGSARAAAWRTAAWVPQRLLGRSACGSQRRRQFGQVEVAQDTAQDGALGKPGQHARPACALGTAEDVHFEGAFEEAGAIEPRGALTLLVGGHRR
jgi:hypothetical protein